MRRLLRRSWRIAGVRAAALMAVLMAALTGALVALLPSIAAAKHDGRALDPPGDMAAALFWVGIALAITFVLTSLGFLYRRQRGLHWDYQLPDGALSEGEFAADDDHGDSH